jgi:TRAP-type mannitol/chloroaromatic compound transport system permease small subunit
MPSALAALGWPSTQARLVVESHKRSTAMGVLSVAMSARAAFARIVRIMAIISGAMFLLCSIYIVVDMLGRGLFGVSTRTSNEISTYVLAAGVAWSLAYTLRCGGHIRIDVVFSILPEKLQMWLDVIATAFLALFSFALAYYSWALALISFEQQTKSLTGLQTPLFVPQSMMALGFSTLTIEALLLLAVQAAQVVTGRSLDSAIVPEIAK